MAEPRMQYPADAVPPEHQQVKAMLLRVLADDPGGVAGFGEVEAHPCPPIGGERVPGLGEGLHSMLAAGIEVGGALFPALGMARELEHRERDHAHRVVSGE